MFSLTDALGFENVNLRLVKDRVRKAPNSDEHHFFDVKVLRGPGDLCRLHEFEPAAALSIGR